jgi:DNA-binding Xre family transcriptional regulator
MKTSAKFKSDYEEFISDPKRKELFDQKYKELSLSEAVLTLMQREAVSVRALAKQIGVSPTIIQGIRSGKQVNITLRTLLSLTSALGGKLQLDIAGRVIKLRE